MNSDVERTACLLPEGGTDWQLAGTGRSVALRIANPRYSRLPVCATMSRHDSGSWIQSAILSGEKLIPARLPVP
jgi:hypothetical protein